MRKLAWLRVMGTELEVMVIHCAECLVLWMTASWEFSNGYRRAYFASLWEGGRSWKDCTPSCMCLLITTVSCKLNQAQQILFIIQAPFPGRRRNSYSSLCGVHFRSNMRVLLQQRRGCGVWSWKGRLVPWQKGRQKRWQGRKGEIHIHVHIASWI